MSSLCRQKSYPGGTSDEFFYMGANQLLVDRGSSDVETPVGHYTQEDYVWLGGRPVVLVRGKLSNTWTRLAGTSADCARNGEAAACGVYFPVTDHLGKSVLMLDGSGHVAGAVDYEPFGHVNRVGLVAETVHPLDNNSAANQTLGTMAQPTGTSPLANHATSVRMRALFHKVDLTAGQVEVVDANQGTVLASVSGTGRGRTWSDWVTPSTGRASVRLAWPGGPANTTSQGVVLDGYEYQRYQTGTQPFWMPLRFPGQYHDAETDLFENWNRYYDPSIGRYLQPEPYLQSPTAWLARAHNGLSLSPYAYASNNPISRSDRTGNLDKATLQANVDFFPQFCGGDEACITSLNLLLAVMHALDTQLRYSEASRTVVIDGKRVEVLYGVVGPIRFGPRWGARAITDPRFENGCEAAARQFQRFVGGDIRRIVPADGLRFLGPYRGHNLTWSYHEVVVSNGRVYDAFTGYKGLPIDEYKALWAYADFINFRF